MPIAALSRPALRTGWLAFVIVVVTGVLQVVPIAAEVVYRPSFQLKLTLLGFALAVLIAMQALIRRSAAAWDAGAAIPRAVQAAAILSLALWPTVIVVARLMYAFVQMSAV